MNDPLQQPRDRGTGRLASSREVKSTAAERRGHVMVAVLLASAMGTAILPAMSLGILAHFILPDLGITRTELGLATAAISGVAAATAMRSGAIADRRGGRLVLAGVFILSGLAIIGFAGAPSFPFLLGFTVLAGVGAGASNPATNLLVAADMPEGQRGILTGFKQAGEMAAVVLAGVALPAAALALGWRPAMLLAAIVPASALVFALVAFPKGPPRDPHARVPKAQPASGFVRWLAGYMLIMAIAGGAISTYLPLYAEQGVGLSVTEAGQVFALMAAVAGVLRIAWSHLAERSGDFESWCIAMSAIAVASLVCFWSASALGPVLLWVGAVGWGATMLSFAAIAMLAVIARSGPDNAGYATGVVLVGFSFGLMLGPPLFGFAVDVTGSYDVGLGAIVIILTVATAAAVLRRNRERQLHSLPDAGSG